MNETLKILYDDRKLRDIDIQFARNIAEVFDAHEHELFFGVLFYSVSSAHTCLMTDKLEILPFYKEHKSEIDSAFCEVAVQKLLDRKIICEAPEMSAPFIKSGNRLYLKAFYLHEQAVSDFVKSSASAKHSYAPDKLKNLILKYFGSEPNLQKAAALIACINSFSVISGGPGTGKTTTVFKVLAILSELSETPLRIAVCAPTGKAAARLSKSIAESSEAFKDEAFYPQIPQKALTLHKLLKMSGNSELCGFSIENPMPYDIVVADEASMVDIRLMSLLIKSLKPTCRLILLGDKDQLASVQPGYVLGDICELSTMDSFSPETCELMNICTDVHMKSNDNPYADITFQLTKSHRFVDSKGIGLLAKACREGEAQTAIDVISDDNTGQIDFIDISTEPKDSIMRLTDEHFMRLSSSTSPADALSVMSDFTILTPTVRGTYGSETLNISVLNHLYKKGLRDNTKKYFNGLPLMITENDYNLNLHNGTTGVIFNDGNLKAWFEEDGRIRPFSVLRLPVWTPAFAMTVHKSQGSEFKHVLFILPESTSPIMTAELFYTAVTRARNRLTIIASHASIRQCISKKSERYSGLFK